MRAILAAILFVTACTATDSVTDLGELATDAKADVQAIRVPLRLAAGESAEFALTVDGPFQAKAVYPEAAMLTIEAGSASTSGVQPVLVVDAGSAPTEYVLKVTNTSATAMSGTFEIGPAAPSCSDQVWTGWFDTLTAKIDQAGSFIDTTERAGIDATIAGRPCQSASDGAFARWHQVFDAKLVMFGNFIDNDEKIVHDLIKGQRPASESEGAYLAWMPTFAGSVTAAGNFIDNDERIKIDMRLAVRPQATTDTGYVAWAEKLRPMLAAAGSFIDNDEKTAMMTMTSGKPCATSAAESQAAWNGLAAAATGDATAILEAARPTAGCQ